MTYDELARFLEWMGKHGRERAWVVALHKQYETDTEESVSFDGMICREDVERFNKEPQL